MANGQSATHDVTHILQPVKPTEPDGRGAGRARAPLAGVSPVSGCAPSKGGGEAERSPRSLGVVHFFKQSLMKALR